LSLRDGPFGDIRVPLTWSAGAALVIAVIIASALLLSHQRDPSRAGAADGVRHTVDSVAAPVEGVLAAPVRWTHGGLETLRGYFFAVSENRRLKAQLATAQQARDQLAAEQMENERLRAVLGIRTDPPLPHITAETLDDTRGPFANSRLADAGSDKGVTEGNPVLSEHGLVGRVVGVTDHVSRIMLLTDAESRTPVILMRTNGRAILSGDGGATPKLDYIRSALAPKEGDRVLTSGDGGVFPRGLPVGTVVRGIDGGWRVALDSDAAPVDYVQILLFTDFAQIANEQALAPKELPTAMTEEPSPSIVGPTGGAVKPKLAAKSAAAPPTSAKPADAKPVLAKPAKPKVEKTKTDKPRTDKPKTDQPKADKPKTDKTKTDKPKADKAKATKSDADKSDAAKVDPKPKAKPKAAAKSKPAQATPPKPSAADAEPAF
jgi:rod shape-determining protein MreC